MTQSRSLPSLPQNNQNKIETACLEASSKFLGSPWKAKKNTVDTNSKKVITIVQVLSFKKKSFEYPPPQKKCCETHFSIVIC